MAGSLGEFEQLTLLAVLRLRDEAYGVTVRQAIEEVTGRDVSAGAVYTTLARLEKRGLVSSRVGESAPERTGQRRKYYTVQPEGAAMVHESVNAVARMVDGLAPQLAALAQRAGASDD
ncbi:MAG: PadR family transcriptional regulator [Acidobacteriota bacterium]|jgi:DNA-binding PadR family transcriptional regulator